MSAPTFQNLGFEIAGADPGLAAAWTLAAQATAEEIAAYGSPERPAEDFERGWSDNDHFLFNLPRTSLEPALYSETQSVEAFEDGWSQNESFIFELGSIEAASYGAGPKLADDFEDHWAGNEAYLFALASSNLSAGPLDGFETSWLGNQSFKFAFATSDLSAGPIDGFESSWTTHMATV